MSDNPPAFPTHGGTEGDDARNRILTGGMTLRDHYAGQALLGLLASGKWDNCGDGFEQYIAAHSHNIADAMLAERAKP